MQCSMQIKHVNENPHLSFIFDPHWVLNISTTKSILTLQQILLVQ